MPDIKATLMDYSQYNNQVQPVRQLSDIVSDIRTGVYEPIISKLRRIHDKTEYSARKRWLLPAFFAGTHFHQSVLPGYHSNCVIPNFSSNEGISVLDLDGLSPQQVLDVRSEFQSRSDVLFCFVSPSGNGIKVGVLHQPTTELDELRAIKKSIRISADIDPLIDKASINNPLLKCFVSSDPDAWYNAAAIQPVIQVVQPELRTSARSVYAVCTASWNDTQQFLNEIAPYVIIQEYQDYLTAGLVLARYNRQDLWMYVNENNTGHYYRCGDTNEAVRAFQQYLRSNHQRRTSGLPVMGIPSLYALTSGHNATFKQSADFCVSISRNPNQ